MIERGSPVAGEPLSIYICAQIGTSYNMSWCSRAGGIRTLMRLLSADFKSATVSILRPTTAGGSRLSENPNH